VEVQQHWVKSLQQKQYHLSQEQKQETSLPLLSQQHKHVKE
jgi:hypothetical protein